VWNNHFQLTRKTSLTSLNPAIFDLNELKTLSLKEKVKGNLRQRVTFHVNPFKSV